MSQFGAHSAVVLGARVDPMEVPVAPNDQLSTDETPAVSPPSARIRRVAVYVIVLLALVVTAWALMEGGERDVWNSPENRSLVEVSLMQVL